MIQNEIKHKYAPLN